MDEEEDWNGPAQTEEDINHDWKDSTVRGRGDLPTKGSMVPQIRVFYIELGFRVLRYVNGITSRLNQIDINFL